MRTWPPDLRVAPALCQEPLSGSRPRGGAQCRASGVALALRAAVTNPLRHDPGPPRSTDWACNDRGHWRGIPVRVLERFRVGGP
jgi:hypothetical protein